MKRDMRKNENTPSYLLWVLILVFTFWFSSAGHAQAPAPGGFGEPQFQNKQQQLQTLITLRLVGELGLAQDQALKVSEIMRKYQMKRRDLRQKMMGQNQQLRSVAYSNNASQASQLIAEIQKTREEMENLDDAQFKEIKPLLTPQQQARYLVLMEDIRREIRQFRRPGPGGFGGGVSPYNPPPASPPSGSPPSGNSPR